MDRRTTMNWPTLEEALSYLIKLGFVESQGQPGFLLIEHPEEDCWFVFRPTVCPIPGETPSRQSIQLSRGVRSPRLICDSTQNSSLPGSRARQRFSSQHGILRHSEKLTTQSRKVSVRFDFPARFLELLESMRAERGNSKAAMVV